MQQVFRVRGDQFRAEQAPVALVRPNYDFVVVDEVQDITNVQLYLILNTLREPGQFLLSGDANQIVHPNFFSWASVKSLFFHERDLTGHGEVVRILHANYRNAPLVTALANRILKLKYARFGSVDRESNYLVRSAVEQSGQVQLLENRDTLKHELDSRTASSTRFAETLSPQEAHRFDADFPRDHDQWQRDRLDTLRRTLVAIGPGRT